MGKEIQTEELKSKEKIAAMGEKDKTYQFEKKQEALGHLIDTQYKLEDELIAHTNGDAIRTYEFHNIWPQTIAAIEVAWEPVDTMSEFSVTWTYDYFTAKNGAAGTTDGDLSSLASDIGISVRALVELVVR